MNAVEMREAAARVAETTRRTCRDRADDGYEVAGRIARAIRALPVGDDEITTWVTTTMSSWAERTLACGCVLCVCEGDRCSGGCGAQTCKDRESEIHRKSLGAYRARQRDEMERLRARVRQLEEAGTAVVLHHRPVRGTGCDLCALIAALDAALVECKGGAGR